MTEDEQIKLDSLKIYEQRLLDEKIQQAANELYDAGNKMKVVDDAVKSFEAKLSRAKQQQELLNSLWMDFLITRDYKKFCEEYTKITN